MTSFARARSLLAGELAKALAIFAHACVSCDWLLASNFLPSLSESKRGLSGSAVSYTHLDVYKRQPYPPDRGGHLFRIGPVQRRESLEAEKPAHTG